ncbi:MAG: bifunctional diaminohydroxyphosphoribosylaminopyrimidine deaminase/5-amino-6-(5-phosphoribosylamino)uracil reductase RibD [Actinomycetota bacterium]
MIDDRAFMERAVANAARIRHSTSPNPWVGAVVVTTDVAVHDGATEPPGGRHAERVALDAAGIATGATVFTTLEPCSHTGRTGPCADALIEAQVARVVVAVGDPDPQVAGNGIARLEAAGIEVTVGVGADLVAEQLAPYLHHRRTGRPWVVAKLAASLDGRTAAPDGTSQWITGPEARADAHRLRAESDAILVGAGTVRADDPSLTVRDWEPPEGTPAARDPRRVVLGTAVANARVQPCLSWDGPLDRLLEQLGEEGVVQLMVEGGARVIGDFHRAGLIDRFVLYQAPVLFGGDDAKGLFTGAGAPSINAVDRGEIVTVERVGADLRIEFKPGR